MYPRYKFREFRYDAKSTRSYDNERRRIESWLGEYMSFRQDASGKNIFISMDSRQIQHNPFFKAFKAKSFTKNDISLHFLLLDILKNDSFQTLNEIMDTMASDYLPYFDNPVSPDQATVRNKLKEYCNLGILVAKKQGKQYRYRLSTNEVNLGSWRDAVAFFSEVDPIGVVGSFLLDTQERVPDYFAFKHNYMLHALESDILCELLHAIGEKRKIEIQTISARQQQPKVWAVTPLKIFVSVQGGRRYLAAFNYRYNKIIFYRLDSIKSVKLKKVAAEFEANVEKLEQYKNNLWGVAAGMSRSLDHIEMVIAVSEGEQYIVDRLHREKRCGTVTCINKKKWLFKADVYNATEMLPWLRTFTGRIISLTCSNPAVESTFYVDLQEMCAMYGSETHDI